MLKIFLACAALFLMTTTQARAGYFPTRPQNAVMHTVTGVLTWYFVGNGAALIRVRDQAGVQWDINGGRAITINGVAVRCGWPGDSSCTDWPSNVVIGTTVVTVSYWIDPIGFAGRQSLVSDQIDVGTQARAHKRSTR